MSIFSKVDAKRPKSSVFNLSHEVKMSSNFGNLTPFLCLETLPGDKFKLSTELLIKLAPLKSPMMHRIKAYVHYFYVPTYQVDATFADFINPKVNTSNNIVLPWIDPYGISIYGKVNNSLVGSLADYLGLPILNDSWLTLKTTSTSPSAKISIDPFKVYQHIYNSFYRDENFETTGLFDITGHLNDSGQLTNYTEDDLYALLKLRNRAWSKDYFTSALPSPQAGNDVLLPVSQVIEADGPIVFKGQHTDSNFTFDPDDGPNAGLQTLPSDVGDDLGALYAYDEDSNLDRMSYHRGLKLAGSPASINDLRRALALQRFKELAERGGSNRYSEMVRNFFGAILKDYWVDRPIFLGGQVQNIQVGEVVQTSMTSDSTVGGVSDTTYLGERGGIAHSYGRTKGISVFCPAHGYIMGILSIRPEATYQQGIERMWTRHSLFDWAFPQFARMGEQEIYGRELCAVSNTAYNDQVFGYTPRYAEYKVGHTHIAGNFRNSLNYWHLGRVFDLANPPTLSKEFVMCDNPSYAAFNVTDPTVHHCFIDLYNKISARRPLPYFGTPSAI